MRDGCFPKCARQRSGSATDGGRWLTSPSQADMSYLSDPADLDSVGAER